MSKEKKLTESRYYNYFSRESYSDFLGNIKKFILTVINH